MDEIVLATRNENKVKEISEILKDLNIKVTSVSEYPDVTEVIEDGKTYSIDEVEKELLNAY